MVHNRNTNMLCGAKPAHECRRLLRHTCPYLCRFVAMSIPWFTDQLQVECSPAKKNDASTSAFPRQRHAFNKWNSEAAFAPSLLSMTAWHEMESMGQSFNMKPAGWRRRSPHFSRYTIAPSLPHSLPPSLHLRGATCLRASRIQGYKV